MPVLANKAVMIPGASVAVQPKRRTRSVVGGWVGKSAFKALGGREKGAAAWCCCAVAVLEQKEQSESEAGSAGPPAVPPAAVVPLSRGDGGVFPHPSSSSFQNFSLCDSDGYIIHPPSFPL
jgi:hypothetical protein